MKCKGRVILTGKTLFLKLLWNIILDLTVCMYILTAFRVSKNRLRYTSAA